MAKYYPSDLVLPAVLSADKFYLIAITNLKRYLGNKIFTISFYVIP